MSSELGPSSAADQWLKNELYGIFADIPVDDDCPGIDNQLCRDMFAESRSAGDILAARTLTIEFANREIRLHPLQDTEYGILCQRLDFVSEENDYELVYLCGTMFWVPNGRNLDIQREGEQKFWPEVSDSEVYENYFTKFPSLIANRVALTGGMLAIRETFSPKEAKALRKQKMVLDERHFWPVEYTFANDEKISRLVPKTVTFLAPTQNLLISAEDTA